MHELEEERHLRLQSEKRLQEVTLESERNRIQMRGLQQQFSRYVLNWASCFRRGISSCTNSFCAWISMVKASVEFGELIYLQLRPSPLATPSHGIWANLLKLAICTSSIPGFIGSSCLFFLHGYLRDFSRKMWWLCGLLECPVKGQPGGWNFPGHHNSILRKTENVNLIIQ